MIAPASMINGSAIIFVADDNPVLLQGLERALTASGYTVETADTGRSILRMLEAAPSTPDLLLLDVMMPEMSGLDVLRAVHADARWLDLPVVLITAATDGELVVSALQHGAADFLTKPFRLGELLARVEAHVGRSRELRRARVEAKLRLQAIDVVRDLNSVVAAGEMFRLVTSRVAEIWNVGRCSIMIAEGEGVARIAVSSEQGTAVGGLVQLKWYPEIQRALEMSEPVLVEDVPTSPIFETVRGEWSRKGMSPSLGSVLAVPFPVAEHSRGVFLLRATLDEPPLDAEAVVIAKQIVAGMSQALGRAQVFETLVEQRRHLHDLAHTDELTGCATRRAVFRYLGEELDLARRRESALSVVLLDLDRFKEINDSYGHPAGDAVLRTFGAWLRGEGAHRASDCAGRYGGDEFVVVLPNTGPEGALRFAERARDYLAAVTFVFGETSTRTSLSAGVASWPAAHIETVEDLIECADVALYQAKKAGRDCVRRAQRNGTLTEEAL
ncbi:MAG: diguanylate cyclase [Gemmatimonadetes bacterium]|nr:diguanylate cyclase [Gemmatimonadota bacterium]